jgi:5-formyltetrahydrofolate cyclo-ligase
VDPFAFIGLTGKTLFVPKIVSKEGYMEFLKVYGTEDLNTFLSGIWGIKEPESQWQGANRLNGVSPI